MTTEGPGDGSVARPKLRGVPGGRAQAGRVAGFVRGDHSELADRMIAELRKTAIGAIVHDEGNLYQYDPPSGLWCIVTDQRQVKVIRSFAGCPVKYDNYGGLRVSIGTVKGTMEMAAIVQRVESFFAQAPDGIAFRNGFVKVNREGIRLLPHVPDNRARSGYPFDYDPTADVTRWLAFLDDIFRDDYDREQKAAFLQEFAGACLCGFAWKHARSVIAIGEGSNGKSTLASLLAAIMPEGTTCSVDPHKWSEDYPLAMLRGKLLNFVGELPPKELLETEHFKSVIAGDQVTARPIRQAPFDFRPKAGHFFSANTLPGTTDHTEGFWRRFLVLSFHRRFVKHEKNVNIVEELLAAAKPGMVAWALEGAARLLAVGEYTFPASHEELLSSWKKRADTVAMFLEDEYEPDPVDVKDGARSSELYEHYKRWALDGRFLPVNVRNFAERMRLLERAGVHGRDGTRYPVRRKFKIHD